MVDLILTMKIQEKKIQEIYEVAKKYLEEKG